MSEAPWIPAPTLIALAENARLSALREAADAIRPMTDVNWWTRWDETNQNNNRWGALKALQAVERLMEKQP